MGTDGASRVGPDDSDPPRPEGDGMGTRWRTLVVPLVATCMLACSTGGTDDGSGEAGELREIDLPEVSAGAVEELAAAGIAVHADDGSGPLAEVAGPVSPVGLWAWQARNLELEWRAGSGVDPEVLDLALGEGPPPPEGVTATPTELVLGWAAELDTPAAAYARDLLGDDADPGRPVPQLVLVLFASDVATAAAELPVPTEPLAPDDAGGAGGAEGAEPPALRRPAPAPATQAPGGPCSRVIDGVNKVVASVFDAVGRLARPPLVRTGFGLFDKLVNGLAKIVVGGVNLVIDGIHFVVENGVRLVIGEVMAHVGRIAGAAVTISQVVALVQPWTLHVAADPALVEAPGGGAAVARVELGGIDEWPDWAADCAGRAGVTLPPLRPEGNPVTWAVPPDPRIAPGEVDTRLREGGTAAYPFTVVADPPGRGRTTEVDDIDARATVQRDDTARLHEAFTDLVRNELNRLVPPVGTLISGLVMPLVRPWIDAAFQSLAELRNVSGRTLLTIRYGVPDEPPDPDPAAGGAPAAGGGSGTWTGDVCSLVPDGEINAALGIQINWVPPQNPGWCVKYMNGGILGLTEAVWLSVGSDGGPGPRMALDDPEANNYRPVDLDGRRAVWSNVGLGFFFEHDGVAWSVGVYRSGVSGILEDHLAVARIMIDHLEDD